MIGESVTAEASGEGRKALIRDRVLRGSTGTAGTSILRAIEKQVFFFYH